jgi:hypothetical protein
LFKSSSNCHSCYTFPRFLNVDLHPHGLLHPALALDERGYSLRVEQQRLQEFLFRLKFQVKKGLLLIYAYFSPGIIGFKNFL